MKNIKFILKPDRFPSTVRHPHSLPRQAAFPGRRASIEQPRVPSSSRSFRRFPGLGLGRDTPNNREKEHGTNSLIAMETAKHQAQAQGRPFLFAVPLWHTNCSPKAARPQPRIAAHSQLLLWLWGSGMKRHFSVESLVKCFPWLPLADAVYNMPLP